MAQSEVKEPIQKLEMDPELMNLSLNGCGYLGIYHVGVCSCIKKFYPQALRNKISGGSVGALVACAFMCDVPLDICAKYVFDVSMKVRNGILGPMSPDLDIMGLLYKSMDAMLPKDAHSHCNGRLFVSATRFESCDNALLTDFKTREELLQALMCSCFIPLYCGFQPPEFYGVKYCDAALSNNCPKLNDYTVTVAPFSGNSHICPPNDGFFLKSLKLSNTSIGINSKNIYMLFRVLFPASPEVQKDICQQGYNDALRYLRDNNLIPCENCTSVGRVPNHSNCELPNAAMPKEITNEIEKAVLGFRQKLSYRLFQRYPVKMLYYLNIPSILTAKVAFTVMSSLLQKMPLKATLSVEEIWSLFVRALKSGLHLTNASSSSNQNLQNVESERSIQHKNLEVSANEFNDEEKSQNADVPVNEEVHFGETPMEEKEKDVAPNIEINVEKVPNNFQSKIELVSISMTSGQACQLELPYSESKRESVEQYMKTCVF